MRGQVASRATGVTSMTEPSCAVNPRGAKRLRDGLPWVYRQDVLRPADAPGGSIVRIHDERGNLVGSGFWAEKSQVAVRLLTRGDERCDTTTLVRRVAQAVARRRRLFQGADAFRAVHGEADLLPGLFADRYGDGLAIQLLSEGAERHRDLLIEALQKELTPRVTVLRNDTSAREFEFLERTTTLVSGDDTRCRYHEGENEFEVDLLKERKTGGFLDQRENHVRAGELARGEALDTFSYHGGFALALARRADRVLAVDQDEVAVETARANAARNGLSNVELRAANAFDVLHEFDREKRRFDTVVVDPPAFAKRKEGIPAALRAYRELNLRALRILRPGGVLVSCSCSAKITPAMFEELLLEAARDAKRPVQVLERRGAGRDHPGLIGVAETEYLKCFVLLAVET
jgi:23S rRNA (cytosine1962-C5)-methyltransferase